MVKKRLLLLFLFIVPIVSATWQYSSERIIMDLDVSSEIEIKPTAANYHLDELNIDLYFYPKNYLGQDVLSFETTPSSTEEEDYLDFKWRNPESEKISFGLNSRIKTTNSYVKVKNKVNFPIRDIPSELEDYINPSETIDSDNSLVFALANEIAKGENDLYVVEFKLADWVKSNIKYDISSITANVAQKSSWVLKTKQGVCDELANLFIGLNRALGIPARFVSGVAYTDSELFEKGWGPHGWAEVYFPGYGWIPFDVTYGEFGFIDPTHVVLRVALDADESSTKYTWIGNNVDIATKPMNIDVDLKDKTGSMGDFLSVDVKALNDNVKFGSYNVITAKVKNLKDYYVASEIYLSTPIEVSVIGGERMNILLKPNGEKEFYWKARVDENLDKNYIYSFPIAVFSLRNLSDFTKFQSSKNGMEYSLSDVESYLMDKETEEENIYSKEISLECNSDKDELNYDEEAEISCNVKNIGNILLKSLDVCILEDCSEMDLGIGEEKEIESVFSPSKTGNVEVKAKVSNQAAAKTVYVELYVHDEAKIEVNALEHPESVSFEDEYKISFVLRKRSNTVPKNVKVVLYQGGYKKEWTLDSLDSSKKFEINLRGRELGIGSNELKINVEYFGDGEKYGTTSSAIIKLNNVTFTQRMYIFFNDIGKWIARVVG